jgi:hypothetical protein
MIYHSTVRVLIVGSCLACLVYSIAAVAQSGVTRAYADDRKIVHIVMASGRDLRIRPEKGQDGVEHILVAPDGKTVGWLIDRWVSCCVSYPLPTELIFWRSGRILRKLDTGRATWAWAFEKEGSQFAYRTSFPHGGWSGESTLVDLATGKVLAFWSHPTDENGNDAPDVNPPDWAAPIQ